MRAPSRISCVAGLDTAANRLHLVWEGRRSAKVVSADKDPDARRQVLYEGAKQLFAVLPSNTLVVCEEPLALRNGKTTRLLSLAAGAIWAAHLEFAHIWWTWADVAQWKKETVGNGNANKSQIQEWVKEHLGLEFPEEDYYDAAGLMTYGRSRL